LIAELTSDSTQARDHSDKLAGHTELDSLQEYWVLDLEKPLLTQYTRDAGGWRYRAHADLSDTVRSDAHDLAVPLRDLYALVVSEE